MLETIVAMCSSKGSQSIAAMKVGMLEEGDSEDESWEGTCLHVALASETTQCRLAIERSFIILRVVVVDNTQGLFLQGCKAS